MDACPNQSFFAYFKENMEGLGLDTPASLFNTQAKAAWTVGSILGAIKTLGKGATLAEIAGATTGLEKLVALNAASAVYLLCRRSGRELCRGYRAIFILRHVDRRCDV